MAGSNRFAYWLLLLARGIPKLIRPGLFLAGIYFFISESWNAGFGCFLVLLWWKAATIQAKLEEIRDPMRGFSDDDVFAAIKSGGNLSFDTKGLLSEIAVVLRDIRNNQINNLKDEIRLVVASTHCDRMGPHAC